MEPEVFIGTRRGPGSDPGGGGTGDHDTETDVWATNKDEAAYQTNASPLTPSRENGFLTSHFVRSSHWPARLGVELERYVTLHGRDDQLGTRVRLEKSAATDNGEAAVESGTAAWKA